VRAAVFFLLLSLFALDRWRRGDGSRFRLPKRLALPQKGGLGSRHDRS
jgi:hypothetical protein